MEKVKKCLLIILVLALVVAIVFVCVNFGMSKLNKKKNPVVTIEFEGYGAVKIELYPDMAPNTVKNFIKLAERGYYQGKTITDIEDSLIRGGLVETTDDSGNPTYTGPSVSDIRDLAEDETDMEYSISGEFIENGYNNNTLSHTRGVVSMYRLSASSYQQELAMVQMMGYSDYVTTLTKEFYNAQSAGFMIMTEDSTGLDGTYAAFGKVIEGMDVVDSIAAISRETTTDDDDGEEVEITTPTETVTISSTSVETYGVDYGVPEVSAVFDFDSIFNMFMSSYMSASSTTTSY